MSEMSKNKISEQDELLITKLLEMSEFLLPLNKYWGNQLKVLAMEFQIDLKGEDREAAFASVRSFIQSPDKLESIYVSQIVKREKFAKLKNELIECFKQPAARQK